MKEKFIHFMINNSQVFVSSRPALQDALKEIFSLRLKKNVDSNLNTRKEIKNTIEITGVSVVFL